MSDFPHAHQVRLEWQGRFLLPVCTCGWLGTARLTESAAREEARDHVLLYAPETLEAKAIAALVEGTNAPDADKRDPARPDPAA